MGSPLARQAKNFMVVDIDDLSSHHLPEVHRIEADCAPYRQLEHDFSWYRRQPVSIKVAICPRLLKVVGFIMWETEKEWLHLIYLAVDVRFRRRGIGSQLIRALEETRAYQKRRQVLLEVRERNVPAQFFFQAKKYRATSVERNYFDDTSESAYHMSYHESDSLPPLKHTYNQRPRKKR
jgi:ribosomal-protein-alanine N-acetyltransferase